MPYKILPRLAFFVNRGTAETDVAPDCSSQEIIKDF